MPRPVVPILALPRKRSVTSSSARWWGMIRCASAETTSRADVHAARLQARRSPRSGPPGSTTTPLPMTGVQPGVRMPSGSGAGVLLTAGRDDGVPGVVAALVTDDVGLGGHRAGRWPCPCPRRPTGHRPAQQPDRVLVSSQIGRPRFPAAGRASAWPPSSRISAAWNPVSRPGRTSPLLPRPNPLRGSEVRSRLSRPFSRSCSRPSAPRWSPWRGSRPGDKASSLWPASTASAVAAGPVPAARPRRRCCTTAGSRRPATADAPRAGGWGCRPTTTTSGGRRGDHLTDVRPTWRAGHDPRHRP